MAKFEAHITFDRAKSKLVQGLADDTGGKWKVSAFDADPIMGDKPYCYLTAYDKDEIMLLDRMSQVAGLAEVRGIPVLRQKIERIIYDTKTGVDEITATNEWRVLDV
jgi:hypothetical protein